MDQTGALSSEAGFAAEAHTPMMMGDKTELSPTFRATVSHRGHRL